MDFVHERFYEADDYSICPFHTKSQSLSDRERERESLPGRFGRRRGFLFGVRGEKVSANLSFFYLNIFVFYFFNILVILKTFLVSNKVITRISLR